MTGSAGVRGASSPSCSVFSRTCRAPPPPPPSPPPPLLSSPSNLLFLLPAFAVASSSAPGISERFDARIDDVDENMDEA